MTKPRANILNYWVPILALVIITIQVVLVNSSNLTKWKGGGFGMYTEVHYYYNEVFINNIHPSLDSLETTDFTISKTIKDVKLMPTDNQLKKLATLVSKYSVSDTITVQVWKPAIIAKNESYSRKLVKQFQFVKQ